MDRPLEKRHSAKRVFLNLTGVWVILMLLTLTSALVAEQVEPNAVIVVLVCLIVAIKGGLVIEQLMGLRRAVPGIRWAMLSYFIVLPPLIAWGILHPELLAALTNL